MKISYDKETEAVFGYFNEICSIPRGSGNMQKICDYCVEFAEKNGLDVIHDEAQNVVIYKPGTKGYENAEPVILQGHLDMVCQKEESLDFDFLKDPIEAYPDGDFIKAKGTTLGADNGIAVAMIMAVLASRDLPHPPIEAVFTTDEEIGMIGAKKLDASVLKGRKLINLDSEEANILTVSCAGGSDFCLNMPIEKKSASGTMVLLEIDGLKGGHSGTDIDKGRINAALLAGRLLYQLGKSAEFDIISLNGGSKANAIPFYCKAELLCDDGENLRKSIEDCFAGIKDEITAREKDCLIRPSVKESGNFEVFTKSSRDKLLYMLMTTPDGVTGMSAEIEGLVETSLNLGILSTGADSVTMQYALRSNKASALTFLEERMSVFASHNGCRFEISGQYAPWEFKKESRLQELYAEAFYEKYGHAPKIAAIHAGLECAVFAQKIKDSDCISIGPDMFDVHTVRERLSISSAKETFGLLCKILEKCG